MHENYPRSRRRNQTGCYGCLAIFSSKNGFDRFSAAVTLTDLAQTRQVRTIADQDDPVDGSTIRKRLQCPA